MDSEEQLKVDQQLMDCFEANVISPMNLVLVGLTGVGKSAAGNTILGREAFKSEASASSLTLESSKGEGEVCGRRVCVVDTPGLFNTELSEEELRDEMQRAEELCDPGPHAFLLVIQLGRFTQQEKRVMETLQELYSERVNQYTLLLFTYGDRLRNKTIEEFISRDSNLQQLRQKCGNQYHVFNNEDTSNSDQVKTLFKKIDRMLINKSPFYVVRKERNINYSGIFAMVLSMFRTVVMAPLSMFRTVVMAPLSMFRTVVRAALAAGPGGVIIIGVVSLGCGLGLALWSFSEDTSGIRLPWRSGNE